MPVGQNPAGRQRTTLECRYQKSTPLSIFYERLGLPKGVQMGCGFGGKSLKVFPLKKTPTSAHPEITRPFTMPVPEQLNILPLESFHHGFQELNPVPCRSFLFSSLRWDLSLAGHRQQQSSLLGLTGLPEIKGYTLHRPRRVERLLGCLPPKCSCDAKILCWVNTHFSQIASSLLWNPALNDGSTGSAACSGGLEGGGHGRDADTDLKMMRLSITTQLHEKDADVKVSEI